MWSMDDLGLWVFSCVGEYTESLGLAWLMHSRGSLVAGWVLFGTDLSKLGQLAASLGLCASPSPRLAASGSGAVREELS